MFLSVQNVKLSFSGKSVLKDCSFQIEKGEVLSLLGPSGCGKTTMLRIISGLQKPDEGRIIIDGQDETDLPVKKRRIGLCFQNYALFPNLTVRENVAFGLKAAKINQSEISARVDKMLHTVKLLEHADKLPRQLSGGQKQRVSFARTMVTNPRLLLLDEPLSNLDNEIKDEIKSFILSNTRKFGITTILVTHDMHEAFGMSDKVCFMHKGKILQYGRPQEVYDQPVNPEIARFLGFQNRLNGSIHFSEGMYIFRDNHGNIPLGSNPDVYQIPQKDVLKSLGQDGIPCSIMFRHNGSKPKEGAEYLEFEGDTESSSFEGEHYLTKLNCNGRSILLNTDSAFSAGSKHTLRWLKEDISIFFAAE